MVASALTETGWAEGICTLEASSSRAAEASTAVRGVTVMRAASALRSVSS